MEISIKIDDKDFVSDISYVIIEKNENDKFQMTAKMIGSFEWVPIASANSCEELKIWWDMLGYPNKPLV